MAVEYSVIRINLFSCDYSSVKGVYDINYFVYDINIGKFLCFLVHTQMLFLVELPVLYGASLKVRKCFVL